MEDDQRGEGERDLAGFTEAHRLFFGEAAFQRFTSRREDVVIRDDVS